MNTKKLTLISILTAIILISGSLKIPSPLSGGEFQMSAPIAVIIAMIFGFKIYISAGIMASILSLSLGITTVPGVIIAMVFRVVVGFIIYVLGENKISLSISGPIGTSCARVVLGMIFNFNIPTLLVAAVPGMVFTVVVSNILYGKVYKIVSLSPYRDFIYYKREISYEI